MSMPNSGSGDRIGNGHRMIYTDAALEAQKLGQKGAIYGALKWGFVAGGIATWLYKTSPTYRRLTPNVKLAIQMTSMMFGAWVEAERATVAHAHVVAAQRRYNAEKATWDRLEAEAAELGTTVPQRPEHLK